MRIYRHFQDLPRNAQGAVVAIGNFDGVHRGHQALIARTKEIAKAEAAPAGVLAFEPHPQEFFHPDAESFRLTPFRAKARLLAETGIDILYAIAFDAGIARRTAEDFVRDVLVDGLGVRTVIVGGDFRFGKGRTGDVGVLRELGKRFGFGVEIFTPIIAHDDQKISSSEIRAALKAGKPDVARQLLGHWWSIEGRVDHGDKRGRELGFPTANMTLDGYMQPAFGVYAVRASVVENERIVATRDGVASIGVRPMFKTSEPLLETYLFDFDGDLYGKHLSVELIAYLRPEQKFESVDALKAQMVKDSEAAQQRLKAVDSGQ
ncbi:MAG TPA: bifunctional riboflavin kinase/FAD synthetase [Rhizomicrobium sp.]|nr:bifunctional riboflavin kinase/FAD synthetase [Rhizomicrobium sp.]